MTESPIAANVDVAQWEALGYSICQALRDEAGKLGLPESTLPLIDWNAAKFSVTRDPADGSACLVVTWTDKLGHKLGSIFFNGDGSFFAEYDIIQPHPRDPRWFVEAVTGWGREGNIKTEPRLLEAVE